jgi:hypothetical protein
VAVCRQSMSSRRISALARSRGAKDVTLLVGRLAACGAGPGALGSAELAAVVRQRAGEVGAPGPGRVLDDAFGHPCLGLNAGLGGWPPLARRHWGGRYVDPRSRRRLGLARCPYDDRPSPVAARQRHAISQQVRFWRRADLGRAEHRESTDRSGSGRAFHAVD